MKLNIYQKVGAGILAFFLVKFLFDKTFGPKYKPPRPNVDPNYLDPNTDFESLAFRVYDAVKGIDWTSKKAAIFEELLYLNDNEFINVYNIYNSKYAKKGRTMKMDIDDEWFLFGDGMTALNMRFKSLGLT